MSPVSALFAVAVLSAAPAEKSPLSSEQITAAMSSATEKRIRWKRSFTQFMARKSLILLGGCIVAE